MSIDVRAVIHGMTGADWCVAAICAIAVIAVAWALVAHRRADREYTKGREDEAREQQAVRERAETLVQDAYEQGRWDAEQEQLEVEAFREDIEAITSPAGQVLLERIVQRARRREEEL